MRVLEQEKSEKHALLDVTVGLLAVILVLFILMTMGIRSHEARLEEECKVRLLSLATAQQLYLVNNSKFTSDLEDLRPFLEPGRERMPMTCPLNGRPLVARVQGDRYKIVAPGTKFYIATGDPSW